MTKNLAVGKFYSKFAYKKILKQYYSKKEILSYKSYFIDEKKKYFNDLNIDNKSTALDVGTGRQSIALSRLFHKVYHFDLAEKHVLQLKEYVKKKKIKNIFSQKADIETCHLGTEKFDFINLDGILMHTSNPSLFLKNISKSLKVNGVIKILIYRSGCLKFILVSFLRELIKKKAKLRSPFKKKILTMLFEDDLYVPNIYFFDENYLINSFQDYFNTHNKYIKVKNFKNTNLVDTKKNHHSLTFFITKKKTNLGFNKNLKLKFRNVLNENFLKNDIFFYNNVGKKLLQILKKNTKNKVNELKINEFEKILIKIYKLALSKLIYKKLEYKNIIRKLKTELFRLEQCFKDKKFD